jgi:hypothetical protein
MGLERGTTLTYISRPNHGGGCVLTVLELEEFRRNVRQFGQSCRGEWYVYVDGPLFGIRVRLEENATDYLHARCHQTRSGVAVLYYSSNPALHTCYFAGFYEQGEQANYKRWRW